MSIRKSWFSMLMGLLLFVFPVLIILLGLYTMNGVDAQNYDGQPHWDIAQDLGKLGKSGYMYGAQQIDSWYKATQRAKDKKKDKCKKDGGRWMGGKCKKRRCGKSPIYHNNGRISRWVWSCEWK